MWNSQIISRVELNEGKVNGSYRDIGLKHLHILYAAVERGYRDNTLLQVSEMDELGLTHTNMEK